MRLINTATLHFKEFFDSQRPPYAILSHTWGEEEISYLDLLFLTSDIPANALGLVQVLLRNPSRESEGFRKVEACCKIARERGFEWVWIDSCCIDKSSSAELSEGTNSMWKWYSDADECYAYLSHITVDAPDQAAAILKDARWFTRWTLQELLAPKHVYFFNAAWNVIGQKASLATELSEITGIDQDFLGAGSLTERVEDMAYCMLGLLDVHMPLIYGEGKKAFMRLQLEYLKTTNDPSILAWTEQVDSSGLLASWPTSFATSGDVANVEVPGVESAFATPTATGSELELRARYVRFDAQQVLMDVGRQMLFVSTAFSTKDEDSLVLLCGPRGRGGIPVTQFPKPNQPRRILMIRMKRFGLYWQRIRCDTLMFEDIGLHSETEVQGRTHGYLVYRVPQDGI